jgi:hypothetical protein
MPKVFARNLRLTAAAGLVDTIGAAEFHIRNRQIRDNDNTT